MRKETCKCGNIKERRSSGNCNSCHAAYTKQWKKDHPLNDEQKKDAAEKRRIRDANRLEEIRKRSPRLGAKPGILRPLCSWCDVVIKNFKKKTFCKSCAAKYNREWRKDNPSFGWQKHKDNVRVKTYQAIVKGDLVRKPCEVCGELKVHAHHDDYNKPLEVRWLCEKHHKEHHTLERRNNDPGNKNHK